MVRILFDRIIETCFFDHMGIFFSLLRVFFFGWAVSFRKWMIKINTRKLKRCPYHYFIRIVLTIVQDDSDVGDIVMLVTLWWWLISDVGGRIIMLAIFSLYWWFSQRINRSSASWIGHQYLKFVTNTFGLQHPSPTSM